MRTATMVFLLGCLAVLMGGCGQSGKCSDVACTALDECHDVGVCDPATGTCSNPVKTDGTACDGVAACTVGTCQAGVCTGQSKPGGTVCDDGNVCTQTDTCQAGVCTGGNPVLCTALDLCHEVGTCDPATGVCSTPAKTCTALDQCHTAGGCDLTTGTCSNPPALDGTVCLGDNPCPKHECQAGICQSVPFLGDDVTPPSIPTRVTKCNPRYGGGILLRWLPSSDSETGVASYRVYRYTVTGSYVLTATVNAPNTRWSGLQIPAGARPLTVSATDCAGNESDRSDPASLVANCQY